MDKLSAAALWELGSSNNQDLDSLVPDPDQPFRGHVTFGDVFSMKEPPTQGTGWCAPSP